MDQTILAVVGVDTIYVNDVGTISDDDFTNFSTVETLTLLRNGSGSTNTTLASNALNAGINKVVGGSQSDDSINVGTFAGVTVVKFGGGSDTTIHNLAITSLLMLVQGKIQ